MADKCTPKRSALRVNSRLDIGSADPEQEIRSLIHAAKGGTRDIVSACSAAIRGGDLAWEDVDLRSLFRATIDEQVDVRVNQGPALGVRTMTTSLFPILTGLLTAELLEREDEAEERIWSDLVTLRQTNKETEHLVRIVNSDPEGSIGGRVADVETHGYPLMTSAEERVQVDPVHDGRRIALTAKLIETNDRAGFVEQVNALREWANDRREVVTLKRVFDLHGSAATPEAPYVYRPNGTGAALYTTSATALGRAPSGTRVENNALVDGDSLQTAINRLATMLNDNGIKAGTGRAFDLVVPHALLATALKIVGSEMTPGVENEVNVYGPRGRYMFRIHSSSLIDAFTSTAWILAKDIRRQFHLVSRIDMEYVSMPASASDFLRTRLGFEARVADEFEIGAKDHNRAVQCLDGTTAPSTIALGA